MTDVDGVTEGVFVGVGVGDEGVPFVKVYCTDVLHEPVLCIVPPVIGLHTVVVYPEIN